MVRAGTTMVFPIVAALTVAKRKKSPGRALEESTLESICTAMTVQGCFASNVRALGEAQAGVAASKLASMTIAHVGRITLLELEVLTRVGRAAIRIAWIIEEDFNR